MEIKGNTNKLRRQNRPINNSFSKKKITTPKNAASPLSPGNSKLRNVTRVRPVSRLPKLPNLKNDFTPTISTNARGQTRASTAIAGFNKRIKKTNEGVKILAPKTPSNPKIGCNPRVKSATCRNRTVSKISNAADEHALPQGHDIQKNDVKNSDQTVEMQSLIPVEKDTAVGEKIIPEICQTIRVNIDPDVVNKNKKLFKRQKEALENEYRNNRVQKQEEYERGLEEIEKKCQAKIEELDSYIEYAGLKGEIKDDLTVFVPFNKETVMEKKHALEKAVIKRTYDFYQYKFLKKIPEKRIRDTIVWYNEHVKFYDEILDQIEGLEHTVFGQLDEEYWKNVSILKTKYEFCGTAFEISMQLAPKIINAMRSGSIDSSHIGEFFRDLCKEIRQIDPNSPFLDAIAVQFSRMENEDYAQTFFDIVKSYLDKISDERISHAEREKIEENVRLFVYNTLVPPYQRDGEGSCFVSSILIKLWYDSPVAYMKIIQGIIDRDTANFGDLGSNPVSIPVKDFGNIKVIDDDTKVEYRIESNYDKIYQKMVSAAASLDQINVEELLADFSKELKTKCEKYDLDACIERIKTLLVSNVVFCDGKWCFATCAGQSALNFGIHLINSIAVEVGKIFNQILMKSFEEALRKNLNNVDMHVDPESWSDENFSNLATDVVSDITSSGGFAKNLIRFLTNDESSSEPLTINFSVPSEDGTFLLSEFQPILDFLGTCADDQLVCVSYYRKQGGAHALNLFAGEHALDKKTAIGHMNYPDSVDYDSRIYAEKMSDGRVKLTMGDGTTLNGIETIKIRSNFMVKRKQ